MSTSEPTNIQAHEGRPVGVKVLVEFEAEEAKRLTELAEQAGLSLDSYLKRLVEEAATRSHTLGSGPPKRRGPSSQGMCRRGPYRTPPTPSNSGARSARDGGDVAGNSPFPAGPREPARTGQD